MEDASVDRTQSLRRSIPKWVHIGLRLVLVALVAKPALSKFVTHENSVSFFDAVGIHAPQLMVIIAGIIEVGAVLLLLAGVGERFATVLLVPVMLVAILYVGPDWKNLSVLFGALAFFVLKTDLSAVRQPADRLLG